MKFLLDFPEIVCLHVVSILQINVFNSPLQHVNATGFCQNTFSWYNYFLIFLEDVPSTAGRSQRFTGSQAFAGSTGKTGQGSSGGKEFNFRFIIFSKQVGR